MKKIIEGWKNVIVEDAEIEALSNERMTICNDCEHKTFMVGVDICGKCLCPLIAKTRSPESSCPIDKW